MKFYLINPKFNYPPWVNESLADAPEKINQNAYDAWLFKLKPANLDDLGSLLDAAAYGKNIDA